MTDKLGHHFFFKWPYIFFFFWVIKHKRYKRYYRDAIFATTMMWLIVIVVKKMIGQYESNKQPNHNFTILELGPALELSHLDHGLRPSNIEGPQIWSGKLFIYLFLIKENM